MDGAGARGEQLEVGVSGVGERSEGGRQSAGGGGGFVLEQGLLVRRMLDVFSDAPGAGVQRDSLGAEKDRDAVVVGADDDLLTDEPPRDGVFVAVEGDAEHVGDAMALDVVGVERRIRQGCEEPFFLMSEDEGGNFSGVLVNSPVGEVVAPRGGLRVEIEQIAETTAGPEAAADEADRSLDASLFVAPSDVAGAQAEAAAGPCVLEKFGIEHGGRGGVREHDGLHVVEDVDGGGAPVEAQAAVHASQERAHRLADREFDVEITGVAENGDERADASGNAGQCEAEVGPVHLHRLAWREVERQERLAMSARAKTPETVAQDRDASGVPEWPQALEYSRREHLGRVVEDRPDGRLIRVEDRASRLGGGFRRCAMPAQDLADGLSRHAETLGDRAHRDALDEAETEHLGDAPGSIERLHFDRTKRSRGRTSRKSPTPRRRRRDRAGGTAKAKC